MNYLNAALSDHPIYIVIVLGVIILIMLSFVINLQMELSSMKRRYRKMMTGVDGANLERMLLEHIDEVSEVVDEQKNIRKKIQDINDLLAKAITKISVVRFNAFDDTGSELSYCVALLDDNNNGVIISAIYGRDLTRSYAKSIENGEPIYNKLTQEEEQALHEAIGLKNMGDKKIGR